MQDKSCLSCSLSCASQQLADVCKHLLLYVSGITQSPLHTRQPQGVVYRRQAAANHSKWDMPVVGQAKASQGSLRVDVGAATCDVSREQRHLGCPANELHDQPLSLQSRMQQRSAFGSALVVGAMQLSMSLHRISIFQHVGTLSPAVVDMPCRLWTVCPCKRQQLCIVLCQCGIAFAAGQLFCEQGPRKGAFCIYTRLLHGA